MAFLLSQWPLTMATMKWSGSWRTSAHGSALGLRISNGGGFWMSYQEDVKRQQATEFWTGMMHAGGDEGTDESLRKRVRMLEKAKLWDPRD